VMKNNLVEVNHFLHFEMNRFHWSNKFSDIRTAHVLDVHKNKDGWYILTKNEMETKRQTI